jgi:hypothetical protein
VTNLKKKLRDDAIAYNAFKDAHGPTGEHARINYEDEDSPEGHFESLVAEGQKLELFGGGPSRLQRRFGSGL